eukprot:scaffold4964_cov122-Isochrysis_galbana.AAC.8
MAAEVCTSSTLRPLLFGCCGRASQCPLEHTCTARKRGAKSSAVTPRMPTGRRLLTLLYLTAASSRGHGLSPNLRGVDACGES